MKDSNKNIYWFIFILSSIGLIGIFLYSTNVKHIMIWLSASVLVALASSILGSLIGFLFGIPKVNSNFIPSKPDEYVVNTSLEQISDWLTKIIIGLGLTQLTVIPANLKNLSEQIVWGINSQQVGKSQDTTFILALILFYFFLGFFFAYFFARLELKNKFIDEINRETLEKLSIETNKSKVLDERLDEKLDNEKELLTDKKLELRKILTSFQKDVLTQILKSNNRVYREPSDRLIQFKEFNELQELIKINVIKKTHLGNNTYELTDPYKGLTLAELQ